MIDRCSLYLPRIDLNPNTHARTHANAPRRRTQKAEKEQEEQQEEEGGTDAEEDEEDNYDDAAEAAAVAAVGGANAPVGYEIVTEEPDFEKLDEIMGKQVLYSWTGAPLGIDQFGWYLGTVSKKATSKADKKAGLTYEVMYRNSETNNVLPHAHGLTNPRASAKIPMRLANDNWGVQKQWVVVQRSDGRGGSQ